MAAAKKANKCQECGAELRLGPAPCPLCGAERSADRDKVWAAPEKKADPDDYQANVRDLREQLRRIRDEGAEAV